MEFLLLGPLEVLGVDGPVAIPAAKQRAVLAILLLAGGATVPGWRLIDDLWPDPPASARKVVQTYVSKLRQVLPQGLLVTHQTGYALQVGRGDLDVTRFEDLVALAARVTPEEEVVRLREALALWRGPALQDFVDEPFALADVARLEAMRLSAYERRLELDLGHGRHEVALAELFPLVQVNPLNERLRGHLMLALYRSDRQSDALRVYREGRRVLVDQLGVEPSPSLRRLEAAILRQDPALDPEPHPVPDRDAMPRRPAPSQVSESPYRVRQASTAGAFLGRVDELAQLGDLLRGERERCVVVTGPAGVGKTRLAVELANRLGGEYVDGWAFVDLTRVADAEGLPAEVCTTLGVRADVPGGQLSSLVEALATREQLLVLDNAEHLVAAGPVLASLVESTSRLTIVLTSRSLLDGLPGQEFHLAPMPVPGPDAPVEAVVASDAVTLFVDRARAVRPDFSLSGRAVEQVRQLCVRLDGLPLAIELAAARADLLSPRAVLARLDDRLDLLTSVDESVPERHRSLRAAVDWSYRLLDQAVQERFCDLSVFTGGFTVDTAEGVVTQAGARVIEAVTSLRAANLLRPHGAPGGEPRFVMLETIREYAQAALADSGRRDEVLDAHARVFHAFAAEAATELLGADQERWLDLVQAELPNVRAAIRRAETTGQPDQAVLTLARLWRFWQVRSHTREARMGLEDLLARSDVSDAARAAGHLGTARCAFHQGDYLAVRDHLGASLPYHRSHDDDFSVATSLLLLGVVTGRSGDPVGGAAQLREALGLATSRHEEWPRVACLLYLGMLLSAQGDQGGATRALEEGLRECRDLGDLRLVGWFLIALGRAAVAADEPARARRRFEEALVWGRRLGDAWSEAWVLQWLASAALGRGEPAAAYDLATATFDPARRGHNPAATSAALRVLAAIAEQKGEHSVAAQLWTSADAVPDQGSFLWATDFEIVNGSGRLSAGPDAVPGEWAGSRGLSIDEALALATSTLAPAEGR